MQVDGSNIVQSSNAMFGVINQAQVQESNMAEKIAVLVIEQAVGSGKSEYLGKILDLQA